MMEASWGVTRPLPSEPNFGGLGNGTAYKEPDRFPPAHGITLFVNDGSILGAYSAVIVRINVGGIYGERVFQAPPLFEETLVTPQCDF